ncbi:MAG TPA: flagellar hook-length control protein FliK, partial [Stenomitos sp.]
MSSPILVTPAAKLLQPKPAAPATPSDKSSFSRAVDGAERRAEAKPASNEPPAREPEAPQQAKAPAKPATKADDKAPEQDAPQAKASDKPAQPAQDGATAQAPVDVQVMVAVASQIVVPAAQPNGQAVAQPAAQTAAQSASEIAAAAAIAPAATTAQAAVASAVATAPAAQQAADKTDAKAQAATPTSGMVATVPTEGQAAIAPTVQPEAGNQQETSQDTKDQAQKAPKPPVAPVAAQQVHQSVESLRAADKVATLVTAHEPAAMAAKGPIVAAPEPAKEAAVAALATEVAKQSDDVQPTAPAVQPWQLPHAVGGAEAQAPAPQAQVITDGAPTGEAMPMREAMHVPFAQAAKDGKPSELRLQLSPEHLGRMEIRVMSHEGSLSAQIRVDHAQARDMMNVQLAELRQSLADQGIKIDKLEVSVGQDRRQDPSFSFGGNMQQQSGQQQQQAHQAPTH